MIYQTPSELGASPPLKEVLPDSQVGRIVFPTNQEYETLVGKKCIFRVNSTSINGEVLDSGIFLGVLTEMDGKNAKITGAMELTYIPEGQNTPREAYFVPCQATETLLVEVLQVLPVIDSENIAFYCAGLGAGYTEGFGDAY